MDIIMEVFVTKVWAIAVDQVGAITRFGRKVLMSANQIKDLARRGRNRIYTLAQIRTMTNKQITYIDEPPAPRACKRLHTGEFADNAKRLAYQEAIAQGFNDHTVDFSDKVNIMEASNCGNLYGAKYGTNGIIKMVSNNGELYGIKDDEAIIIVSNVGTFNGGNGTNGTKNMAIDNGEFDGFNNMVIRNNGDFNGINKGKAVIIASNGGNLYGGNGTSGTNKKSSENDDLMVIDDDTISIDCAINGN